MKKILFLRREGVYLPEINAYMAYVREKIPNFLAYDSSELKEDFLESDFDIVWKFMGVDRELKSNCVVHEYGSLSIGNFSRIKNFIKRVGNVRPSRRVFLNELVRQEMGFRDNVPYRLRDMGVASHFFRKAPNPDPEFEFVYAGSLNRGEIIFKMLDHFKTRMKDSKLLVIGAVPDNVNDMFGGTRNIRFTGRLKYEDVPQVISEARYGLNIMPDIYPFNIQTSTKILEYCAAQLPVITTNYTWVRDFEKRSGGQFFYLNQDFSNLNSSSLRNHNFMIPSVEAYRWDEVISNSQVFDFLYSFPNNIRMI